MDRDFSSATDVELLRLAAGSDVAFTAFYRRYERLVVGWLLNRTRRPDLTADLTAEVFAAAYLGAAGFRDGPEPVGAWLLGIARHKLLGSLRDERIDSSARRRLGVERIAVSDESLARIEELRDLGALELLHGLPEDQREAIRARVIDDADYAEVAERLAISPAAARQRVSRGLATLRRTLQREGEQP